MESVDTFSVGETLHVFEQVCLEIGVPLAKDKTTNPCTELTVLGIEFDTQELVMHLPMEKTEGHAVLIRAFEFCMQGGCPRSYILSQANKFYDWCEGTFSQNSD